MKKTVSYVYHYRENRVSIISLTCRELYKIGYGKNKKINRILDRIPAQADYVLREYVNDMQTPCIKAVRHCEKNDDYDRVA